MGKRGREGRELRKEEKTNRRQETMKKKECEKVWKEERGRRIIRR